MFINHKFIQFSAYYMQSITYLLSSVNYMQLPYPYQMCISIYSSIMYIAYSCKVICEEEFFTISLIQHFKEKAFTNHQKHLATNHFSTIII